MLPIPQFQNKMQIHCAFQVFYYSTNLFTSSGLTDESAKFATIGIGCIMVCMTLVSIPLMDRTGRRTLHLYGLGGMFIFSIFITISFLIKVSWNFGAFLSEWTRYFVNDKLRRRQVGSFPVACLRYLTLLEK